MGVRFIALACRTFPLRAVDGVKYANGLRLSTPSGCVLVFVVVCSEETGRKRAVKLEEKTKKPCTKRSKTHGLASSRELESD